MAEKDTKFAQLQQDYNQVRQKKKETEKNSEALLLENQQLQNKIDTLESNKKEPED